MRVVLFLLVALCSACASVPASVNAPVTGPALPSSILDTAQEAKGVSQVRVYFAEDGTARKLAVYHGDVSQIPSPVLDLVKKKYPKASIQEYETEFYADAGLVYEVEIISAEGSPMEVSAFADGRLRYVEAEMDPASLSPHMREVVVGAVPGGVIAEVEMKTGPEMDLVQVKVKPPEGVGFHYLVFETEGSLVRHTRRYPAQIEVPVKDK